MIKKLTQKPIARLLLWLVAVNLPVYYAFYRYSPEEFIVPGFFLNATLIASFCIHLYFMENHQPAKMTKLAIRLVIGFFVFVSFTNFMLPITPIEKVVADEEQLRVTLPSEHKKSLELPSIWFNLNYAA